MLGDTLRSEGNSLAGAAVSLFIAVDGIDGSGKTTLVNQLADLLQPFDPIVTKEPTSSSKWGRLLRDSASSGRLPRATEIEYFHLDRIYHLEHVIIPMLKRGRAVITDRYVDSTLAFQAESPKEAQELYKQFLPEIREPDLTIILDCLVAVGQQRIQKARGKLTKFEDSETLERAKSIYDSRNGTNYCHLDANGSIEFTFGQAVAVLCQRFPAFVKRLNISELCIQESGTRPSTNHRLAVS